MASIVKHQKRLRKLWRELPIPLPSDAFEATLTALIRQRAKAEPTAVALRVLEATEPLAECKIQPTQRRFKPAQVKHLCQ